MLIRALVFALVLAPAALAAETPPQVAITLSPADVRLLETFIAAAKIHVQQDDGTTHPYVDGSELLTFLRQRVEAAKRTPLAPTPEPSPSPSK